jgi:uncharacterized membrane protein (DUF485 family)
MSPRYSPIALSLFFLYLLFYGGFVLLAAFSPATLERLPAAGVNLAIWYGFGLILAAVALAVLYGWACRARVASPPSEPGCLDAGARKLDPAAPDARQ